MSRSDEVTGFWIREPLTRNLLFRRSPVLIMMVYYAWILWSAWFVIHYWGWSFEDGLWWSSGPPGSIVPFPRAPGPLAYIAEAYLLDQVFYLIFMHSGVWILWIALGVLYTFSPYRLERTIFCSLLRGVLIVGIVLFLLLAAFVTNMHPIGLQLSVYFVGLLLMFSVIVWLVGCKKRYAGLRVIG